MVRIKYYFVYILTNWNNRVLYIGITNNIERRIYEHKHKLLEGFTSKYNLNKLIYFETFEDSILAITREKELKKWRREKKDELIMEKNPNWKDLSVEFEI
ncbi:GIY-YIG nuclease family protein [bacterium]|nr:GIY-YIG nuclease family protein [bacterium]